jgi:hypothetical protein
MLVMVTAEDWVLVSVDDFEPVVLPIAVEAQLKLSGVNVRLPPEPALKPLPERVVVLPPFGPSWFTVALPVRVPAAVGVKTTEMEQLLPAGRMEGQSWVRE